MGSSLSEPEAGFRKSLSKRIDKAFKPKSSGQTTPVPTPNARSPSPHPKSNENSGATSAPALAPGNVSATPTPTTPARAPSPAPSTSPPAKPATDSTPAPAPKSTQATTTGVWTVLEASLRTLHKNTSVFPPVQSAVGSILGCLDFMQQTVKDNDEREELASELSNLSDLMVQHMQQSNSPRMSDAVLNAARGIEEQVRTIKERRDQGAGGRLLEARDEEELLGKCYRRIGSLFRQLQADASMSMWKVVNDQASNALLDRLRPVHLATYDSTLSTSISRRTCTANTRTAILSDLNDWSYDPTLADIYWMNGMAGTGKTTIACTFSESLEQSKRLAASFFCTRTVPECRSATRILPTIAYQLARYSVPFQSALCRSLQEDPDVGNKNLTKQFDRLLKEPLLKVKEAMPSHLVVVIDALDECDDMRQVELLLRILLKGAQDLPIRFFVTSRPEPEVYSRMMAHDQGSRDVLHLHEVEKSLVQADIDLYLQEELAPMSPKPADIQKLVQRSGTLFIYAATLVRYIQPDNPSNNPTRRLQSVLSATSTSTAQYSAIDTLYSVVLHAALDENGRDAEEVEEVQRVLHTVVCVQEPLSMESLTVMAKLDDKAQTLAALQQLRAVIHVSETSGLVSTLHASFPDFMFTEARSKSHHCISAAFSQSLARRCFEVMESQLRFNICNLESSFVPDAKVEGIDETITRAVSPALWYACRYWGDHLKGSSYSDSLCSGLERFLANQLLFWMEVMNLKRRMGSALEVLAMAESWISPSNTSKDMTRYVEDSRKFISSFAANPISQSTPHIYISALPFCPKSSFVFEQYYKRTKGLINATGSALEERQTTIVACWTVESEVRCIAPSPDGSKIAYGCENGVVAIRSATDGIIVLGPLEGHADLVNSIAYSPDGSRMVTSSKDKTIRIWNTGDGTLAAGPQEGHTDDVVSVAYSPDGTRAVSSSNDHTIRVWDTKDGTLAIGPLEGHANGVWSVAYSPDGSRIVSGAVDGGIRIWNAQNGAFVTSLVGGSTKVARSITYSPDGAHIALGSYDKTVHVWNASDGALIAGPLESHTDLVMSVAYSPDGTRIISGSRDNTICIWDAQNGALVTDPLQGHTGLVRAVAYSPDGTRIISGSTDSTIRVWNALGGAVVAKKSEGHAGSINSVAYSPDGTCVASGSNDHTIRIWHAHNGSLTAGPLEGHTFWVTSVAYSPSGTRIVSGSRDQTIRVWSARDSVSVPSLQAGGHMHLETIDSIANGAWTDGSGWVTASDSRLLLWVPPEVQPRGALSSLRCPMVIEPAGTLLIDYGDLVLCRRWAKCYQLQ